jgi:hypothetical protein
LIHKAESFFSTERVGFMVSIFLNTLSAATREHVDESKTRRQTLCWLIYLIMRYGTVCLWRLAAHAPSMAKTDSVRRRFYRFFQSIRIDPCVASRMVVGLLGLSGKPWTLVIDRTNWNFGKVTINILMIAVVWNGVGIPLIWTFLSGKGNSPTQARTQLLDRLRENFADLKIAMLIGDREFIGSRWMTYLIENNVDFIMRLRENQLVARQGYATWPLSRIAHNLRPGQSMKLKGVCYLSDGVPVRIVMMRLKSGELLALACPSRPARALALYRQRWTVETLFANLKTRGFDLEATHMTNPEKLSTLMAILAIATALAVKTGAAVNRAKPVSKKGHGRAAASLFSVGLTAIKRLFAMPDETLSPIIFEHIVTNRNISKPRLSALFCSRV